MNEIETKIRLLNNKYLFQIRRILNRYSYLFTDFQEATAKQDKEEGFDAIFTFPEVKIPIRIRDYEYLRFMDFTIRSQSKYGQKTEIDKLKEGFGDYYFYCWEDESKRKISRYIIIDLNLFRITGIIDNPDINNRLNFKYNNKEKGDEPDGTAFHAYNLEKLIKNGVCILYEKIF